MLIGTLIIQATLAHKAFYLLIPRPGRITDNLIPTEIYPLDLELNMVPKLDSDRNRLEVNGIDWICGIREGELGVLVVDFEIEGVHLGDG